MKQVLIVDTDKSYRNHLEKLFYNKPFVVYYVGTVEEALHILYKYDIHILITELTLNILDGVTLCRLTKSMNETIETLILTSNTGIEQEADALASRQVDLYLNKSIEDTTLREYIDHLDELRIVENYELASQSEAIIINDKERAVFKDTKPIHLTFLEYEVLRYLLIHKNRVVSREEFMQAIWSVNLLMDDRIVDSMIKNIRKKLNIQSIITIRGVGYIWSEK